MFSIVKQAVVSILRVPPEPADPVGGEGSLQVFRAAPNYYKYKLVAWGIGQAFALLGAVVGLVVLGAALSSKMPGPLHAGLLAVELLGLALVALQFVFSYCVLRLDYEMRWYKVTDRSLRIREGVLHVREMTMTFANIQNISITQGPLQRFLGIADLRVQSAGGGGSGQAEQQQQAGVFDMHVGYFRGVENAGAIRDLMTERLRKLRDSGLGDHDDAVAAGAPVGHGTGATAVSPAALEAARGLLSECRALRHAAAQLAGGTRPE